MAAPNTIDLDNILEPRRPVNPVRRTIILWLVVIGLAILFLPLYLISTVIGADVARLEGELSEMQLALAAEPTVNPTVVVLQQEVAAAQAQANELSAVQTNLTSGQINWPQVMTALNNYDTNQLAIDALAQTDNRLLITGQAIDDAAVIAYARQLEDSGQFARVVVQSISLLPTPQFTPTVTPTLAPTVEPTPTTAPTATPVPSTGGGGSGGTSVPAATSTPKLYDEYEWDDTPAQAKPIFLGQLQSHNFYPTFDVDNGYFLAKAGRFYQIATAGLAPGVDTFLTVTFGSTVLTNDDSKPGTLGSQVDFQAPGDADVTVQVQVSNRGQYGSQMTYQLYVQEVVPTVVPTPTSGPVPTNAPSATPTLTATPTFTPTATPDLRDPYEPDDVTPSTIAVGETQLHNFYPANDLDKATFIVKKDRFYQVVTTQLALGVDTLMAVTVGNKSWENDDYDVPGSGNFASAVCFQSPLDAMAVTTLTNKALQYNPDKTYNLHVAEIPGLTFSAAQLAFGPVPQGGPNPPTQPLLLGSNDNTAWTASADQPWITVDPLLGNAPTTINVGVNVTGLGAGDYVGHVNFAWQSFCRQMITVTLQVAAPLAGLNLPGSPLQWQSPAQGIPYKPLLAKAAAIPAPLLQPTVSFVILVELEIERLRD